MNKIKNISNTKNEKKEELSMEFFDKLGKKASEAYKLTADKTGKIAKEAKLKIRMNDLKNQVNDIYKEIGKKVYEKHIREENIDIKKELEEECTQIDVLSSEIEDILKQCRELKDKRQCQKCHTEIDKEAKFCPECGEKQEEPIKEAELLQDPEESGTETQEEIEDDEYIDSEIEESKDNLEKTVEIESDVEE